jgi:hypothetical protein
MILNYESVRIYDDSVETCSKMVHPPTLGRTPENHENLCQNMSQSGRNLNSIPPKCS